MSKRMPGKPPILGDRLILADGSTGTALEALAPEAAAEGRLALLPLEGPDLLEALHAAYFDAGSELVETATFSASARDLGRYAEGWTGGAEALCYAVNKAAASLAAKAALKASRQDTLKPVGTDKLRLVAGSMGPGDAPPSLGASTYAELLASYLPQARGLADGGADLAIIETCQDPLQIKAAIAALRSPKGGRGLPFIVSATVDGRGRMLAGADIAAFVAIVSPFAPLAIGLNCSGGPDELAGPFEELASISPWPLCFMPNAGLPRSVGGHTYYPFGPEVFAEKVEALARRFGIAVVGGCCGTSPAHIAALDARLRDRPRPSSRPAARPALSSLYAARLVGPELFKIGERANSAGSAAFAALLDAGDFEAMAEKALAQEGNGAAAIDIHLSRAGRDEAADMESLVTLLAARAQAALCVDTGDPDVLARALPLIGGRPLINSTSLEDPARAARVFALAAEYGAAVVCLAMDGAGPARSVADKVRVCRALYEMATGEFGLQPDALFFDPLTFTIAAGGDARATIDAIAAVKNACPGSLTVLGVGNVSFGLPKSVRPAVTSLFIEAATRAGLDAAIMDTGGIPSPGSLDPGLRAAALRALGFDATSQADPSADRLDGLLAWAAEKGGKKAGIAGAPQVAPDGEIPREPAAALAAALYRGDAARAEIEGRKLAQSEGAVRLSSIVSASMAESGRLWNEGRLSLPLVLRSAEAARRALAVAAAISSENSKGTIVMATVKGDLHDIGKNIVSAILACSGWRIVDLGTDVPAATIAEAAQSHGAIAIGLSGLLTRSLAEMKSICELLGASGSKSLVLCGGAAVEPSFIAREVEPKHPGLVRACKDAFDAASLLGTFADSENPETDKRAKEPSRNKTGQPDAAKSRPIEAKTSPAFAPPFLGPSEALSIPFTELLGLMERKVLFSARWGYRREEESEALRELELLLPEAERLAEAKAVYGYFRCRRKDETSISVWPANSQRALELPFPRERGGGLRTLAAYFAPGSDIFPCFAVTAGPEIARAARAMKDEGKLEAYWRLHGLGSALAEAGAQWAQDRISADIKSAGASIRGRRYSFGFPACPGTEYQDALLDLLGASRIGLRATEGHQLDPEHSVTAFVIARPDAVYFEA